MKNILIIIFCLPTFLLAQAPQGFTYQGVATNNEGVELSNHEIAIKASVIAEAANGILVYEETHLAITDAFGLFNVVIGLGQSENDFSLIDWGDTNHFLKIELDINGGNEFIHIGTQQMMSVPYALYAENAGLDSTQVAGIISEMMQESPYLNDDSDFQADINNLIENSQVNGSRVIYLKDGNIIETDEMGSFNNTIYDSEFPVYATYYESESQTLHWIERMSIYSGTIKKSSLDNFNPQSVSAFTSLNYLSSSSSISGFDYENGKYYFSGGDFVWMVENGVTTQLLNANTGVYDVDADENGNVYYSQNNYLKVFNGDVSNVANIDGINEICLSNDESKIYYSVEQGDNIYLRSVGINGETFEDHMSTTIANFNIDDFKVVNSTDFYIAGNYSLAKFNSVTGLQHFLGLQQGSYFISIINEEIIMDSDGDNSGNDNVPIVEIDYKIYYLKDGNIIETDEMGSFNNTIYDSEFPVYATYYESESQTLHWIERMSIYSGTIKKSSLDNFNPQSVSAFTSLNYLSSSSSISGFDYENGKYYFSGGDFVWMVENGVTTQLLNANTGVYDVDADENGNVYYSQNNYLKVFNGDVSNVANIDGINEICLSNDESKIYYSVEQGDNIYLRSVGINGETFEDHMSTTIANFNIDDFKVVNSTDFYIAGNYSLAKFNSVTGLQHFLGLQQGSYFISIVENY